MSLSAKVKSVERLFRGLDKRIAQFQKASGLNCASGCGKCCTKSDIHASVLEFLPFAYHFYHENDLETVLEFVNQSGENYCNLFKPMMIASDQGYCGNYKNRGLICRLFGYSAVRNKHGHPAMFTCTIIKALPAYGSALGKLTQGLNVPFTADYYRRLAQIDFGLANEMLPINEALKRALQEVVHYYTYRPKIKPRNLKKAG